MAPLDVIFKNRAIVGSADGLSANQRQLHAWTKAESL